MIQAAICNIYQHRMENNQKEPQKNDDKFFCLCPFWYCSYRFHFPAKLQYSDHHLLPKTFLQPHHPRPRDEICCPLICSLKFAVLPKFLIHTYYFSVFDPCRWNFGVASPFIVIYEKVWNIDCGLPSRNFIILPFDLIEQFPIFELFVQDS